MADQQGRRAGTRPSRWMLLFALLLFVIATLNVLLGLLRAEP